VKATSTPTNGTITANTSNNPFGVVVIIGSRKQGGARSAFEAIGV